MDVQLKKGILEACALAALKKGDSYGYLLLRDISKVIEISESTLYPILRRLEKSSYLSVYSVEQDGRLRKYYRISEKGIERLNDFLEEWEEITKVYNFIKNTN